ncbi:radical SAM family heme chaperone HemW [Novosphingobium cyanobacteriorum]|uniref:Heme chaperone HemW n=1 Tax=Novosphingobium cyanobacteriorum TaxID=3024215 RepID=A0ABT6CKG7_9SPHN|nr:radical SAM family heme chaperone HemW [Novosphingobium cyanobacteriorum]MDF8334043.1 radical SAM family heme chaperone HemW [Novosphingobium cyanobacteriorum]
MQPLALYIHWPFCLAKCPYCDFNSHVRERTDVSAWKAALFADMGHEAAVTGPRLLTSIFFGGGTPSLMPPDLVAALIEKAREYWTFAPDIEITLEANPSSVEAANFAALADAGINRTSLGLQALDDKSLQFLGRLHDAKEGIAALEVAQRHFARVSFDLIYARPDHSPQSWKNELSQALAYGTGHLSLYQLTIEPGTRFATLVREGKFTPLDDDAAAELFDITQEMTGSAGLPAYEISNHARAGEQSRHNLTYWRYLDYAGIGPGAHGRRLGRATVRHRKPENYLRAVGEQAHGIVEERPLGQREQASEAMLMGLRLAEGVNVTRLASRFGLAEADLFDFDKANFHHKLGYLRRVETGLKSTETGLKSIETVFSVTETGMPLLDALLADLIPAALVESDG